MPTNRARLWCYTFFNYSLPIIVDIKAIPALWHIFQEESTKSKTGHLQGCIYFHNAATLSAVKKRFPKDSKAVRSVHLEQARGTPHQNQEYCTKESSRKPNGIQWSDGTPPAQGNRRDLLDAMAYLENNIYATELILYQEFPLQMAAASRSLLRFQTLLQANQSMPPIIKVFSGKTGTGKSYRAMNEATKIPGATGYFPPGMKGAQPWADGCQNCKKIVIEDFEPGSIPYRTLLRMLDQYPMKMPIKGGFINWAPTHIWITSNYHPECWYPEHEWTTSPLRRRLMANTSQIIRMNTIYKNDVRLAPIFTPRAEEDNAPEAVITTYN